MAIAAAPARAHDPINGSVTWTGDVERLVQARCVGCHVAGGRGPMPLTSYEEARPWARAIREEVLARRMPKWHAARGYGQFANDRSLTPFEIALFVAWVDGGARKSPQPERGADKSPQPERTPIGPGFSAGVSGTANRAARRKTRTLPCREQPLPRGRLLAVRPNLDEDGSAGISVVLPDGTHEVVAWIRGFEKQFSETYWLRTPIDLPNGARLKVDAQGRCRVTVTLE